MEGPHKVTLAPNFSSAQLVFAAVALGMPPLLTFLVQVIVDQGRSLVNQAPGLVGTAWVLGTILAATTTLSAILFFRGKEAIALGTFVGGVVKWVLVDVSGDPFADLAREAAALYARQ